MAMDFEDLAARCRDTAFRNALGATNAFNIAVVALDDCLTRLTSNFRVTVGVNGSSVPSTGEDDDEDDGLGYTIRVDRSQLSAAMSGGAADLAPRAVAVADRTDADEALQTSTSVFRFLRNACVESTGSQDGCRASDCLRLAHVAVIQCCEWVDVEDADLAKSVVLLAQVALQFAVNCVTGNLANQAVIWELFFPDHFQKVLVECQEYRKICAFIAALALNCVNASEGDELELQAVRTRGTDLVCARNLVITFLQRCIPKPVASSAAPSTVLAGSEADDPAFEWICVLFRVLFRAGHARDLYNAVGAHMLSRLWSRVTPEQLILLRMFALWVDYVSTANRSAATASSVDTDALVGSFEFVKSTWVFVISADDEDRPDDVEEVRKLMWIELENEAKLLLLDVCGELTVKSGLLNETSCQELLRSVLTELGRLWALRPSNPKASSTTDATNQHEPEGYRSRLIRVAGNLCFRDTARQDLVRDEGFIPLLLNHCNIDESNPLIREWSLVALRNVCEGNAANQAYINELRPQGMDSASETALRNSGVSAEIGEDGKVELFKSSTNQHDQPGQ